MSRSPNTGSGPVGGTESIDLDNLGLGGDELTRLVEHLQTEERESQEASLSSLDSFHTWLHAHPALRQMAVVEKFSEIGPAIMRAIRQLLGL